MSSLAKKIGEGVALLSSSNMIARIVSFVSYLLILYFLSLQEYGIFVLILSLIGPLSALAMLGLSSIVVSDIARFIGEQRLAHAKKFIYDFAKVIFSISFVIILLTFIFRSVLVEKYGEVINQYFLLLTAYFVIQLCYSFMGILFRAHEKFHSASLMVVLEAIIRFLTIIAFIFSFGLSIATVLASYIISSAIVILITSPQLKKTLNYFSHIKSVKESVFCEMMKKYGKWSVLNSMAMRLINPIATWSVQLFLGTESVAIWSLAIKFYGSISELFAIEAVFLPIISKRIHERHASMFMIQKAKKYMASLYFLLFLGMYFIVPLFINTLIPKYIDSIPILKLCLFLLFVRVLEFGQATALIAMRKQKFIFAIGFLQKASKICLIVVFTFFFGLVGTAVSKILSPLVFVVIKEYFLRKWYKFSTIGIKGFFIFDEYDKLILGKIFNKIRNLV